jgi:hypothetical protein
MTTTASASESAWDVQLKGLKTRYPAVRDTILFCFYALTQDPEVDFETLKDQASERGLRITNASVNGAKRLIANNEGAPRAKAAKDESDQETAASARVRRPRPAAAPLDAEALIRASPANSRPTAPPRPTNCATPCAGPSRSSPTPSDPDRPAHCTALRYSREWP